ncbi:T9SS type A sorting domain-containing protein [Pedobacter arcticus]|uniref:T9SS type A sorting domain-containing protein n=1 Tax=Pedobacter arcticus TaxID=752140 RepID=UPI0002E3E9F7|nr:T9SS type A sorting domain-containing protein [Pedobacter arcticus]
MKKTLLLAVAFTMGAIQAHSQFVNWENAGTNYVYDFSGNRAPGQPASLEPIPTDGYKETVTTASLGWMPAPSSGTAYLRYSGAAEFNGGYKLVPFPNPTGLEVLIANGGPNKLSLIDAAGATEISRFSTTLKFGDSGTKGLIRLMLGNTDGFTSSGVFTSNSNLSSGTNADIFAALGILYGATGIKLIGRNNPTGSGTTGTTYPDVKSDAFVLGRNHELEVFMNNSVAEQEYTYGTNTITIPSKAYHVWIDGVQLDVAGAVNFPAAIGGKTEVPVNKVINAFGFSHLSGDATTPTSTVTFSNIRFDYAVTTLPIVLSSFTAKKQNDAVKLNWTTASEKNNAHFDILRSSTGKEFQTIEQVSGAGNSNDVKNYSYTDYKPASGTNYYQLRQVDFNGTSTESEVRAVTTDLVKDGFVVYKETNNLVASIHSATAGRGSVKVANILGDILRTIPAELGAGYTKVDLGNLNLKSGVYLVHLVVGNRSQTVKFIAED